MFLLRKYENWRVLRLLKKNPVTFSSWQSVRGLSCMQHLSSVEKARLRVLAAVLLQQKKFTGVQGLELTQKMKLLIAAQACVPVLKLGLNYYSSFTQVTVYPAAFWVERNETDAFGVVHHAKRLLSGESWSRGPLILSWQDIEHDLRHDGYGHNVIIHEFVHKIDMLDQYADGVPPFVSSAEAKNWGSVFREAYQDLNKQLAHRHKPCIDAYAATSPAEYFAVVSECFFSDPRRLIKCSEKVYQALAIFYQQEPIGRE